MQFNDKTKRIVCVVLAVVFCVPIIIGAVVMLNQ